MHVTDIFKDTLADDGFDKFVTALVKRYSRKHVEGAQPSIMLMDYQMWQNLKYIDHQAHKGFYYHGVKEGYYTYRHMRVMTMELCKYGQIILA